MEKDYFFICRGCERPDKNHWFNDDGEVESAEGCYGRPHVSEHHWARNDAYGIYTGLYCGACYKKNYPYKRGRYHDPSYAGERLDSDY